MGDFGKGFGKARGANRGFKTIGLSTLSSEQRSRLKRSSFAIPERRAYPIENKSHARNALARVSQYGSPSEQARVRAAVHRKYPSIGYDFRSGGRPDTKRGLQHHSLGDRVYGFDAIGGRPPSAGFDKRVLYRAYVHDQRRDKYWHSDPIVADSANEARRDMERQLYPHEMIISVKRYHPPGCQCPFHGGHPGRKGGVGFNMKGIGTFPAPRRATI